MRSSLVLFLALALAYTSSAPRTASACSCSVTPGPVSTPAAPWFSDPTFPTNGLFTSPFEWHDASGARLELAVDDELTASLGFMVRRPTATVSDGDTFFPDDDCPATGTCRHALVFGASDVTAPSVAEIVDVTVQIARDAPETGQSCQVDTLTLELGGSDDRTAGDELVAVVFLGATEEDVAATETFSLGLGVDRSRTDGRLVSTVVLGGAEGHRRDEGPLRASGTFCFAVSLMDTAGNIGDRSATRCLDTTDPEDPAVALVPYAPPCSGAFCTVSHSAAPSNGPLAVVALAAGIAFTRSVRRRRAR